MGGEAGMRDRSKERGRQTEKDRDREGERVRETDRHSLATQVRNAYSPPRSIKAVLHLEA